MSFHETYYVEQLLSGLGGTKVQIVIG